MKEFRDCAMALETFTASLITSGRFRLLLIVLYIFTFFFFKCVFLNYAVTTFSIFELLRLQLQFGQNLVLWF
jgi:hypothetical protein